MDITSYLAECVRRNNPVSFSKYGDGEHACALGQTGHNCDADDYTRKKQEGLLRAIRYMVDVASNAFISKWPDENSTSITEFWQAQTTKPIRWALQHTILFDGHNDQAKVDLYKAIKSNNHFVKIIICNESIAKAKRLLDLDHVVIIPRKNWFDDEFDQILLKIVDIIVKDGREPLVITCCGVSAKIMIYELSTIFPNGIFLDFGSGLDKICTKETTRLCQQPYDYLVDMLQDILPSDW